MSIFGRWLAGRKGKEAPDPIVRVRGLMGGFIEACFVSIDAENHRRPSDGRTTLLFMFGAVDMLCQVNEIDERASLELFESMLQDELGEFSPEQAHAVLVEVIQATTDSGGKRIMREGAESIRGWLTGTVPLAPHRLIELLGEREDAPR